MSLAPPQAYNSTCASWEGEGSETNSPARCWDGCGKRCEDREKQRRREKLGAGRRGGGMRMRHAHGACAVGVACRGRVSVLAMVLALLPTGTVQCAVPIHVMYGFQAGPVRPSSNTSNVD